MNADERLIGWVMVGIAVWLSLLIGLHLRELLWYYQHRGQVKQP